MKIAVYGSLRKGEFNFEVFQLCFSGKVEFLGTTTLHGYDLYSLGSFPAAVVGSNDIVVDLLDVDARVFSVIQEMEFSAGYYEDSVEIEGENYGIFLYPDVPQIHYGLIESGDWSNE